jgi:hypothetical protein
MFVIKLDFGMNGTAIAFDVTYGVGLISILLYLFVFTKDHEIKSCFKTISSVGGDIWVLIELAFTNVLWAFTDYYSFFSIILMSGAMGLKE